MKPLLALTIAATKRYLRDFSALFFTLVFPIALLAIFGALSNQAPTQIDMGLVNLSSSEQAKSFEKIVIDQKTFKVEKGSEDSERQKLDNGKRDIVVIIPENFGEQGSKLTLLSNSGKAQQAQIATQIISTIVDKTYNYAGIVPKINIDIQNVNSKNLNAIDFLTPGLIAQSILQLGIFGVAFAFVSQKATGTLKRILATPVKAWQLIIAEGFSRMVISLLQVSILILLSVLFFQLHIVGNIGIVFLFALMGIIIFLSIGFAIAGFAKDENQVPPIANLIFLPMFLLSGVFFPRDGFPDWLKTISDYFPLTFLVNGMREVMNNGAGLDVIGKDFIGLGVWMVISFLVAYKLFKWE